MRRILAGVTAAAALGPAAAAPAQADGRLELRAPGAPGPLGDARLSDERRVTRFANAVARVPIRRSPTGRAARVATLRYATEDGPLEVYLVLRSHVDPSGRTWLRIRIPMRPNGRTGWVLRQALGELRIVRTSLRVNRGLQRATLSRGGRVVWSARIGVGKRSTPTPAGRFWIRTRLRGLGDGSLYGPLAFGTSAYSVLSDWPGGGVIGIHGTNEPQLIPGRPSHGCIRLRNDDILRLARLMPIGTPVEIV